MAHVIASITPASAAHGEGARLHLAAAGTPVLERLAIALGAAQHRARPRAARRSIVVVAGDHGAGDPGLALGAAHPTAIAATAIAAGEAALAQVARASRTPVLVIDAGAREPAHLPATAVRLGRGPSADLLRGAAMSIDDAITGLEAGIALTVSLASSDDGIALDLLAVGALGLGAELASAALLAAATGAIPTGAAADPQAIMAARAGLALAGATGVEWLAAAGGPDTAVLAGVLLAASSMNIPVILDSYATGAAALVAARLAPAVTGYLIAAHLGTFTHPEILAQLGLRPLFEVGLGHGEGTGAAMALALADQVAAIAGGSYNHS